MTNSRLRLLAGRVWMDLKHDLLHFVDFKVVEERAVEEMLVEAFKDVIQEHHQPKEAECVVFTNGCFDILHAGHVRHLIKSRALGTKLIVGINTDDSIRRLKGDGRPINSAHARLTILAALSCVDSVCIFGDDTPEELIRHIRPHILTKGPECAGTVIPGAAFVESYGGKVVITAREYDTSTTGIVEKMRRQP